MAKFEIDSRSVIKFLALVAVGFILFAIYDILLLLFIAYVVMAAMTPTVVQLERRGWPRWAAVLMIFGAAIVILGIFVSLTFVPLISQTQILISRLPGLLERSIESIDVEPFLGGQPLAFYVEQFVSDLSSQLTSVPGNLIKIGVGVFGGFINTITIVIFTFYLALERERVHAGLIELLPYGNKEKLRKIFPQIDAKLGAWLRGQFVLMVLIGCVTYIGLLALGVPFALPLAVIAGFLEIIPIIGPVVSSFPAILVGLAISPWYAVAIIFLYTLIQQLESSIIVPKVMHQTVGLDPIVVIIALMIGGRLAGPLGALLAVPLTAVLLIVYRNRLLD